MTYLPRKRSFTAFADQSGYFERTVLVIAVVGLLVIIAGCDSVDPERGYTSQSLYRTDIKTVFVEMFDSRTFRRQIEYDLTRAICQQLETHSPYKVVSDRRRADTILYGRIQDVTEGVLTRQRDLDRPVQNEVILTVFASWKDLRNGDVLMDNQRFRISARYAPMLAAGVKSAEKKAANEAARVILQAMESPW